MTRELLEVVERDGATERTLAMSNPSTVTADPEEAARGCDLAIIVLPAFLHAAYLSTLAPFLETGCVIVGLPGQPGFEFDVRESVGRVDRDVTVIHFDSLPWIYRLSELGRKVTVLGTKERLVGALEGNLPTARVPDPVSTLQLLLGEAPRLGVSGHVLGITLRSPNASNHPPMMYSRWKDWDGRALAARPFYEGIDAAGANLLSRVSEELVATADHIMATRPGTDLARVIPQYQWEIDYYGNSISDPTNLLTALRLDSGYAGITHPMVDAPRGGWLPDFGHRFLSEDVPFGLVVMRGVVAARRGLDAMHGRGHPVVPREAGEAVPRREHADGPGRGVDALPAALRDPRDLGRAPGRAEPPSRSSGRSRRHSRVKGRALRPRPVRLERRVLANLSGPNDGAGDAGCGAAASVRRPTTHAVYGRVRLSGARSAVPCSAPRHRAQAGRSGWGRGTQPTWGEPAEHCSTRQINPG